MRTRRSRIAMTGLAGALLVTATSAAPALSHRDRGVGPRSGLDLVSSAHPSEARTVVTDTAVDTARTGRREVSVDAAALASATCTGCAGDATTVQVVYLRRPRTATVDNVATAWSQCVDCGATSLSVQVVVAFRPSTVVANNRALAVNAVCAECDTSAAAYQLVFSSDTPRRLSRSQRAELEDLVAQLEADLRSGGPSARLRAQTRASADPADGLDRLDSLVNGFLPGSTVERDVDVATR